jgi:hypothetical protein
MRVKAIRIRMGETMGVSFNGRTEGRDHKGEPLQACADDKGGLEGGVASGGFGRDSDNGSRGGSRSVLIQVIEGEIIPRLFLAHRHRPQQRAYAGDPKLWTEVLGGDEIFANLFLGGHTADIVGRLQELVDNGVPRQRVYVDILAPIARRLGTFWEEGRCSFDDMARGLACIDEVVQEMRTCSIPVSTESPPI